MVMSATAASKSCDAHTHTSKGARGARQVSWPETVQIYYWPRCSGPSFVGSSPTQLDLRLWPHNKCMQVKVGPTFWPPDFRPNCCTTVFLWGWVKEKMELNTGGLVWINSFHINTCGLGWKINYFICQSLLIIHNALPVSKLSWSK